MHECPHCGSKTITCRHCSWTWNPRDPNNLPDTCPRCRCDWTIPFKWSIHSKYGHGALQPCLKPLTAKDFEKLSKRFKIDRTKFGNKKEFKPKIDEDSFNVNESKPKKHLKELSV
jgi:hypothetical protein